MANAPDRFEIVARLTSDVVWEIDLATKLIWWSDGLQRVFGYAPEDIGPDGAWCMERIHPDDRERVQESIAAVQATDAVWTAEFRFRRGDGSYAEVLDRGVVIRDEAGRPARMLGALMDVTARRAAERELEASAARFRSLVESSSALVWWARGDGFALDASRWEEVTGRPVEEFRGWGWVVAVHPDDRERVLRIWDQALRERKSAVSEHRIQRADGCYRWVSVRGVPILDDTGNIREWVGTVTDIDDARRVDEALRENERRLRRIVDSNIIGVLYWEETGPILDANDAFLQIIGRTRDELRAGGLSWRDVISPDEVHLHEAALANIRRTGATRPVEAKVLRPDGTVASMLYAGTSLGTSPLHGVTWVMDITERKRAEAEREGLLAIAQRAREDAESANRAKDEFLAMLGHELRNPLSAVRNAIFAAGLDPAYRERALEIARRQADQLGRLVDDLLDVARITHGRIPLRAQRVRFGSIVERAVETARPFVEERAHTLTVTPSPADLEVDGDVTRLEQVVVNLVNNAAKFTPPGGEIRLTVDREGAHAVLRVRDSGVGLAPEMLQRVFDLFAQADRGLDRAQGGLGIGLTVVRRLVELHGGRVEARSDGLGRGAEFVVRLPALAQAVEAAAPGRAVAAAPAEKRVRVLLVEDNPDAAETLMMLLQLLGHHVRIAPDGFSALELAATNVPDVILVDIGLPGMDGYEVARRIRADVRLRRVLLVALTGYGREEDKQHAMAAGFDYHLVKPVDPRALQGLVARFADAAQRDEPTRYH
jgi:PAS domain S-box-containing protein